MAEELDEFGIPIKKSTPTQEFDEYGVPLKKKEPTEPQTSSHGVIEQPKQSGAGFFTSITESDSEAQSTSPKTDVVSAAVEQVKGIQSGTKKPEYKQVAQDGGVMAGAKKAGQVVNAAAKYQDVANMQRYSPINNEKTNTSEGFIYSLSPEFSGQKYVEGGATVETKFGKDDPLWDVVGMDYWINADKRSQDNGMVTGLMKFNGSQERVVPIETSKVVDEYMNHLKKVNPTRYQNLLGKKEFAVGEELRLLREAFAYQRDVVTGQYVMDRQAGKKTDESGLTIDEKYELAFNSIIRAEKELLKNGAYSNYDQYYRSEVKRLDDEQKKTDEAYNKMQEESPFSAFVAYNIGLPVGQAVQRFGTGVMDVFIDTDPEAMAEMNRSYDYLTPSELKGDIWGEGGFNFNALTYKATGMAADMYFLLGGTKGLTKLGAPIKPSLFASSYVQTYNSYYSEAYSAARELGMSKEKAEDVANEHSMVAAGLTSALELISPNTAFMFGSKNMAKEAVKYVAEGATYKDAIRMVVNEMKREIPQEVLQELTQMVGDKMANARTNEAVGENMMSTAISGTEIFETILLTSLATGAGAMRNMQALNQLQKSAIYAAANDPSGFRAAMDEMVKYNKLDKDQVKDIETSVEEVRNILMSIPEDTRLNEQQQMDLASIVFQRKQIEGQMKNMVAIPGLADKKIAEIDAKLEAIDADIAATIKQKGLKEIYEQKRAEKEAAIDEAYRVSKESSAADVSEGAQARDEYAVAVQNLANESGSRKEFVDRMMEEDFDGEIEPEQARKYYAKMYDKIKKDDSKNEQGVSGEVREGQGQPIEEGSAQEIGDGGVVQETQEITPEVFSIFEESTPKEVMEQTGLPEEVVNLADNINKNFEDITQQMLDNNEDLTIDCEV